MNWEELINLSVYHYNRDEKEAIFQPKLLSLAKYHYQNSADYRTIIDGLYPNDLAHGNIPPLAVGLFKHHLLTSIPNEQIFKITTSSGTTSQQVSRIVLDKDNIKWQQKVLSAIVKEWLGTQRLPMLIIDHSKVIKDKYSYSARGVGIQGLSIFGHHHTYALNKYMEINLTAVEEFFKKFDGKKIFIFGFTFMIWQYFIHVLSKSGRCFDLSDAVVLHTGGWKKLENKAVSNQEFKQHLRQVLGQVKVHNFYAMVEQTGTIYVECENGYLHCPLWSDIVIKSKTSLASVGPGIEGVIQVNSLLPTSYPGHALLTEDLGIIIGQDDCPCGRQGKYFQVKGRLPTAEVRGCSDTQS